MYFITLLSVVVIAMGFTVLHYALTHKSAELRVAGWVLVIGGFLNIIAVFFLPPSTSNANLPSYRGYADWGGHSTQCLGKIRDKGLPMTGDKQKLERKSPAKVESPAT